MWRTWRTPAGAATLRILRPAADGAVSAAAWGPGAEWAIAAVPGLLGRDDDWTGLDVSGHRLLRDSLHRNPGPAADAHRAGCWRRSSPRSSSSV